MPRASVCPAVKWGHNTHLPKSCVCVLVSLHLLPRSTLCPGKLFLQAAPTGFLALCSGWVWPRGGHCRREWAGYFSPCCAVVWPQLLSKNLGHVTFLNSDNACPSPCTFRLDSCVMPASTGSFDAAHSSANSPLLKFSSITSSLLESQGTPCRLLSTEAGTQ